MLLVYYGNGEVPWIVANSETEERRLEDGDDHREEDDPATRFIHGLY